MALPSILPARRRRGDLAPRRTDWGDMLSLKHDMNRMFEDFFSGFGRAPLANMEEQLSQFAPSIDVSETSDQIKINAELPGMEEKDVAVSLEEDHLLLSGERREETKSDDEKYYHRELSYGSFHRAIPLNAAIDAEKVEARFQNGVLKVTLPKAKEEQEKEGKKIEIKST